MTKAITVRDWRRACGEGIAFPQDARSFRAVSAQIDPISLLLGVRSSTSFVRCWGVTMLVGGRRSTPRTMSHGFAGGQVPPALLFQVLSPGRWGNPLPLLAGSLLVIALAVAGLVAPTPAIAAVPVQTRPASPTAVLADRMGEAVVVPESVLPPNNETAITKPTVAQLLGLGVGRSPKRDESKTVVPMTSEGWSISLTSTATTVITLTATITSRTTRATGCTCIT